MNKLEKKEILETYNWIKIRNFKENPYIDDYKTEYYSLLKHHQDETEFLINKIREIVKNELK